MGYKKDTAFIMLAIAMATYAACEIFSDENKNCIIKMSQCISKAKGKKSFK
jgi:hypothetical protein